jgi:hypothetical protein
MVHFAGSGPWLISSLPLLLPPCALPLQAALQYVYAAAEATSSDGIQDLGSKVLASQCHGLMGSAKLEEAAAARVGETAWEDGGWERSGEGGGGWE